MRKGMIRYATEWVVMLALVMSEWKSHIGTDFCKSFSLCFLLGVERKGWNMLPPFLSAYRVQPSPHKVIIPSIIPAIHPSFDHSIHPTFFSLFYPSFHPSIHHYIHRSIHPELRAVSMTPHPYNLPALLYLLSYDQTSPVMIYICAQRSL